ncbi:peroxisomal membrane anchor protein conserved region-domain-containing protein [Gorgonomyces haynaldii]|nr:peroxisomal membrane anchor protein conserved region-domain-containing protein [Gorgonomyces haynaldii]
MTEVRQDMVQSAVKFLTDPKVTSAPLAKKIAFLESKGLSTVEIETALAQSKGETIPQPVVPQRPVEQQKMTWNELALSAAGVAGISYLGFTLQYIFPLFQFPSPKDLEQETLKQNDQMSKMGGLLTNVDLQTQEMIKIMNSYAKDVSDSLDSVKTTILALEQSDRERGDQIFKMEQEIQQLKTMLPTVIEKNRESQDAMVTDLHNEIKSLKNLLNSKKLVKEEEETKASSKRKN